MDPQLLQLLSELPELLTETDMACGGRRLCELGRAARKAGHPYNKLVPLAR